MATGQIGSALGLAEIEKFLNCGWLVALGDGSFAVGWGNGSWRACGTTSLRESDLALFAPDFYLTRTQAWWVSERALVVRGESLLALLTAGQNLKSSSPAPDWRVPRLAGFAATFATLQNEFRSGNARKAVPVVYADAESEGGAEVTRSILTSALRAAADTPLRLYGWWKESEGILGLTPETLFTREPGGPLKTMALAGTRRGRLNETERDDFLNDAKERAEHGWVVEDLRDRLAAFGPVSVGATGVLQLTGLAHMHTPIEVAITGDVDFETLAKTLHPTPALGFAPRSLGFDWMKSWDRPELRGRFGAPFGVRVGSGSDARLHCLVAIRNVQWVDRAGRRRWRLGAGCGVVEQSVLENEWTELAAKRESVRQALGL